jgi:hypothetical protein
LQTDKGSNAAPAAATLTVASKTISLISLTVYPSSVVGGKPSTGTVKLSSPAPSGGAVVTLTSSNTAVATVPASVIVASGQTTATFMVTTNTVTSSTYLTISAGYAGTTRTAKLTVKPSR